MYSIFAAEVPFEDLIKNFTEDEQSIIMQYVYNKDYKNGNASWNAACGQGGLVAAARVAFDYKSKDKTVYPTDATINQEVNLQTTFNMELYNKLTEDDLPIVVCGEALSHCVQFSARDLIEKLNEDLKPNKVFILENGSSPVVLTDAPAATAFFAASANKFLHYMKGYTGLLKLNTDANDGSFEGVLVGGRRRRGRGRRITKRRKAKKAKKTRKH